MKAYLIMTLSIKGVFKGGGFRGFNLPPKFSDFFKNEGKEIERKRNKGICCGGGGGGLPLNIFLGLIFFGVELRNFQGRLKNFPGV